MPQFSLHKQPNSKIKVYFKLQKVEYHLCLPVLKQPLWATIIAYSFSNDAKGHSYPADGK